MRVVLKLFDDVESVFESIFRILKVIIFVGLGVAIFMVPIVDEFTESYIHIIIISVVLSLIICTVDTHEENTSQTATFIYCSFVGLTCFLPAFIFVHLSTPKSSTKTKVFSFFATLIAIACCGCSPLIFDFNKNKK
jgi:surface polysaccharide O-acyltransferase-like enzyme